MTIVMKVIVSLKMKALIRSHKNKIQQVIYQEEVQWIIIQIIRIKNSANVLKQIASIITAHATKIRLHAKIVKTHIA